MVLGRCFPQRTLGKYDLGLLPSLGKGNGGVSADSLTPPRAHQDDKGLGAALTDPNAKVLHGTVPKGSGPACRRPGGSKRNVRERLMLWHFVAPILAPLTGVLWVMTSMCYVASNPCGTRVFMILRALCGTMFQQKR